MAKFGWKSEDIEIENGVSKAEINKNLTPQGCQALSITESLEADIRDEWTTLTHNIERGTAASPALAQFKQRVMGLMATGMSEAWEIGAGEKRGRGAGEIEEALASQEDYLNKFIAELIESLGEAPDKDTMGGILMGNGARAVLYAGAAWALYNASKLFKAPPEALYEFRGPSDARTCQGCSEEAKKGPRPAKEIRLPGSLDCLGRCRHEIIRVK